MKTRPEILLHPNIPKPMHGMAPRVVMGDDWWNTERQKAYASTDYHCAACGVHKTAAKYHQWLEAHELYEMDYENGKMIFKEIVPLCHACHNYIHSGLMNIKVDRGQMTKQKFYEICKHGDNLTRGFPPQAPIKKIAEWSKWRMVFNGQEYGGKFKSFEQWKNHYK